MANRTDSAAKSIRGTDPQNLVEKILRSKIYQSTYWREQCFGLTVETLVDKAMELDHIGTTFGENRKPTHLMCLVLKMLQIQPEKDIVVEFIKNYDYKYVRILGAFYLRLTGSDVDVYGYLEPLYIDYRKLRQKLADGRFACTHVDEVIDELITKDYYCDIALPRIKKRWILESLGSLEPRKSALGDDRELEEEEEKEENEENDGLDNEIDERDYYHGRSLIRERDRDRRRESHSYSYRDRYRDRDRGRERERQGRERERRGRDRKRHVHSSSPKRRGDGQEEPKKQKKKKEKKDDGTDHPDTEIAEANKLRAVLGLKPLIL